MAKLFDCKAGDNVFVVPQERRYSAETPFVTTIIRVGRKYAYILRYGRESPFCRNTGESAHSELNVRFNRLGFDVYVNEEEFTYKQAAIAEHKRLSERLLNIGRLRQLDPITVKKIHRALDEMEA